MGQSRFRLTLGTALLGAALLGTPAAIAASHSGATGGPREATATTPLTTATDPTGTTSTPAGAVSVNAACYVNTAGGAAKITVTGANWSPGDTIQLTDALGVLTSTVTTSSTGTFTATVPAPVVPTRDIDVSDKIRAIDQGSQASGTSGGPTAYSAAFLTTDYAVKVSGTNPLKKLLFNLSGFTANRTVYGHYLTGGGRLLATASFGKPGGSCGVRKVDAYEFPGGKAKKGTYMIQFDNDAHYSPRTSPDFRYVFTSNR